MAVVAPDLTSAPALQAAHVPDIHPQHSDEEGPNGQPVPKKSTAKRIASSDEEDDKPLAKKPRASAVAARRKVIESDDDEDDEAVSVQMIGTA
jgi:DNA topoisomerase-1